MVKKTTKERIYLTDEEKKVLAGLLTEWNEKPDKKSRDAFISSEALPKIQQLNISKYGPDIISKDKAAKMLWDCRIQVSYSTFHMHTFYIETIGRLHLVQKQQTLQRPSRFQAGKENPPPESCSKAKGGRTS
jgi:hypothetical protein